ncbi:MAG: hypothetical protein HYZ68_05540, partial [Chloroflexi bacterium]|nr:hypothetical protein [Chloroflexota bacterium]
MRSNPRLWVLRVVIFIAFGFVIIQSAYLQLVAGESYREQADDNRFRLVSIPTPRGVIYDRYGTLLVRNLPSFSVSLLPAYLPEDKEEQVIARLSELLGLPVAEQVVSRQELKLFLDQGLLDPGEIVTRPGLRELIRAGREEPFVPLVLARDVPREVAFIIEEEHLDLPGVLVQAEAIREYLTGPLTAHLLGYVGPVPRERLAPYLEAGYEPWERVGLTGVELALEDELRGRLGRKYVEVDAAGREVRTVGRTLAPQPGHNLILTIDLELQSAVVDFLQRGMLTARSPSGVAIAMDPRTGEILAMVSLPHY